MRPERLDLSRGGAARPMRMLFALPGLHRTSRGAEVAFESVASELARRSDCAVTLIGSGHARPGQPYRFVHAACRSRQRFEHWPSLPVLRSQYAYEELTFLPALWSAFKPRAFDVTFTCGYPFVNWALRARRTGGRPLHMFVTQNGDWPAFARRREFRYFSCDGLVCTNPVFYERNRERWRSALIPNGVDAVRFREAVPNRRRFGLPDGAPVAIIVSALIPSKRVTDGIRAAARVPGLQLLVLGDGEERHTVDRLGAELMAGRYRRMTVAYDQVPSAYASADVLLHMSREESFGNVYIEALACGLPVVAHDWASTRWILGEHGVLVDSNNLESVSRGIVTALARRSAAQVEARCARVEQRFTWSAVAEQYATFARSLLEKGS